MTRMCFESPYLQGMQGGQTRVGVEMLRYRKWESRVQEAAGSGPLSPLTIRLSNTPDPKWVFKLVTDRDYPSPFACSRHVGDQASSSALECVCLWHYFRMGNIVTLISPVYLSWLSVVAVCHNPSPLLTTCYRLTESYIIFLSYLVI